MVPDTLTKGINHFQLPPQLGHVCQVAREV